MNQAVAAANHQLSDRQQVSLVQSQIEIWHRISKLILKKRIQNSVSACQTISPIKDHLQVDGEPGEEDEAARFFSFVFILFCCYKDFGRRHKSD